MNIFGGWIDSLLAWPSEMPVKQQAILQQQYGGPSARELGAESFRQMWELRQLWRRQEERILQAHERDTRRASMIGRLDDCRWRVDVLMASKKLPAMYAINMPNGRV